MLCVVCCVLCVVCCVLCVVCCVCVCVGFVFCVFHAVCLAHKINDKRGAIGEHKISNVCHFVCNICNLFLLGQLSGTATNFYTDLLETLYVKSSRCLVLLAINNRFS